MPDIPGNGEADGLPEWRMPPMMIGGYVTGPVLIGRSDRLVVAARQVVAFPSGIEVDVEAHARGLSASGLPAPGGPDRPGELLPLFRVRFPDGREAVQDDESGLRRGQGPTLMVSSFQSSSGGPGGHADLRVTLWIWPLPPPGELILTCSWRGRELPDAVLVLDGHAIQAAARRAQPFWASSGA